MSIYRIWYQDMQIGDMIHVANEKIIYRIQKVIIEAGKNEESLILSNRRRVQRGLSEMIIRHGLRMHFQEVIWRIGQRIRQDSINPSFARNLKTGNFRKALEDFMEYAKEKGDGLWRTPIGPFMTVNAETLKEETV